MAEQLIFISNILLAGAAIVALIAIFLWFQFRVWKIIGDLSGKNERRSLEQKRADMSRHAKSDSKRIVYGNYRTKRFANTDSMRKITKKLQNNTVVLQETEGTVQLLDERVSTHTQVLGSNQDTVVLGQTEKLNQEFTVIETILFIHTEEEIKK